jgi:Ca2+/H+ antiporter
MAKPTSIKTNILMIAIALIIALIIPSQVDGSQIADSLGARFIPYFGCGIVIVSNGVQLAIRLVKNSKIRKKEGYEEEKKEKTPFKESAAAFIKKYGIVIITLAMAFAATFIIEYLGYILTCCLLCTGMLLTFKEKRWYFYVITYALVALVYIGFSKFLYVPLPSLL